MKSTQSSRKQETCPFWLPALRLWTPWHRQSHTIQIYKLFFFFFLLVQFASSDWFIIRWKNMKRSRKGTVCFLTLSVNWVFILLLRRCFIILRVSKPFKNKKKVTLSPLQSLFVSNVIQEWHTNTVAGLFWTQSAQTHNLSVCFKFTAGGPRLHHATFNIFSAVHFHSQQYKKNISQVLGNQIETTKDISSSQQRWSEDTLQGHNHHVFELGLHIHTISSFNTDFPDKKKTQTFLLIQVRLLRTLVCWRQRWIHPSASCTVRS